MADAILLKSSGGTTSDDCTALKSHVLAGKTAVTSDSDDEPIPGTMPERGDWNGSVGMNGSITIPEGHHSGKGKVTGPAVTQRGAWTSRLGINGKILIPEGYHNGKGYVDQAIQTQGALTLNPGTTAKTGSVSGKYMTGNITVPAISIPASAIKKGHKITFPDGSSVTGTFEGWVPVATDLYYNGQNPAGFTSDSITFENTRLNFKYSFGELNFTKTHDVRSFSKLNLIGDIGWTKDALQICLRDADDKNIVTYEKFDGWTSCALDVSQLTSIPSGWNLYFRNVYTGTERNHYITRIWLS